MMNEVFRVLIHEYMERLVTISQRKLRKLWRADVCQALDRDATLLQDVMRDLVRSLMIHKHSLYCIYVCVYVCVGGCMFAVYIHTCFIAIGCAK